MDHLSLSDETWTNSWMRPSNRCELPANSRASDRITSGVEFKRVPECLAATGLEGSEELKRRWIE